MKKFDQELATLKQRVVDMGELAESMVTRATRLLSNPHQEQLQQEVREREERLDQMQLDIDHEAIRLLTIYGPVAGNLRFIMSVSRITAELERMGDHAVNMCETVRLMVSKAETVLFSEVRNMARAVGGMVHDALAAFHQEDSKLAQTTMAVDDLVDALNDEILRELLSDEIVREALTGPADIASALGQMLIARSLERIADQATNVCEEIVYMVKGADIRHQDPEPGLAH